MACGRSSLINAGFVDPDDVAGRSAGLACDTSPVDARRLVPLAGPAPIGVMSPTASQARWIRPSGCDFYPLPVSGGGR